MSEESTESLPETIVRLTGELSVAAEDLIAARTSTKIARMNETSILNRYNEISKRLDEAIEALKKSSPVDTDWRKSTLPRNSVPCTTSA